MAQVTNEEKFLFIGAHAREIDRLTKGKHDYLSFNKIDRHNRIISALINDNISSFYYMLKHNRECYVKETDEWYKRTCQEIDKEYIPPFKNASFNEDGK